MEDSSLIERDQDKQVRELLAPLARVAPVARRAQPKRHRARSAAALVLGTVLATAYFAAPWERSNDGFSGRALAAVGGGRFIRAVVEGPVPFATVVDLKTGDEEAVLRRLEATFDEKTGQMVFLTYVGGAPAGRVSGTADPALSRFVSGFRDALADGSAQEVGSATLFGQTVQVLRMSGADDNDEEVALERQTLRPVGIRFGAHGAWSRVVAVETFAEPREQPQSDNARVRGTATTVRTLAAGEARPPLVPSGLWVAETVADLPIRSAALDRLDTVEEPGGSHRAAPGVTAYYEKGSEWVQISQSLDWHAAYGFYGPKLAADGPVPAPSAVLVGCPGCATEDRASPSRPIWTGQLRIGAYVRIRASSRELVLSAARALYGRHGGR